jgi:hypothetical protein
MLRNGLGGIVLAVAGLVTGSGPAVAQAPKMFRAQTAPVEEPIFQVVPPAEADGQKFSLPTSRLHKVRVRIIGPQFVSGYRVTTQRGSADVAAGDIQRGTVVLMVDEGTLSVEGTGWGRKVCEARGQARVGPEVTLGCTETR